VKLEITDDAIVLEGERKDEREENRGGLHVTERRYGRFYRAIPLPDGAKTDDARAKFENGVLEVTVPTEQPKSKRREIPIQGASQATKGSSGQKPAGSSESTGGSERAA
jgi:HSP20 family protein